MTLLQGYFFLLEYKVLSRYTRRVLTHGARARGAGEGAGGTRRRGGRRGGYS